MKKLKIKKSKIPGSHRTGTLIGLSTTQISKKLGFKPNIKDDPSKVVNSWGFEINGGVLESPLLKSCVIHRRHYYSKRYGSYRDRGRTNTLKLEYMHKSGLPTQYIDCIFWKNPGRGDFHNTKRVVTFLGKHNEMWFLEPKDNEVLPDGTVVDHKANFEAVIKHIHAKKLEDQPYDVIKREYDKRPKDMLRVYTLNRGRESVDLDVNNMVKKYVYLENDLKDKYQDLYDFARWMGTNTDYQFCLVMKTELPKVKKCSDFITLEKFIKDFKATDAHMKYFKAQKVKNRQIIEFISRRKNLNDKFLSNMIAEYDFEGSVEIPILLQKSVDQKEINRFTTLDMAFRKYVRRKYPLLWAHIYRDEGKSNSKWFFNYMEKQW